MHHLEPETHAQALKEINRVLKPNGVFWISTQTPHQHMNGFWWTPLIPKAAAAIASRFSGTIEFENQLKTAGLTVVSTEQPKDTLLADKFYLKESGPDEKIWRGCDSTWSKATKEELEAGQDWWRNKVKEGKA